MTSLSGLRRGVSVILFGATALLTGCGGGGGGGGPAGGGGGGVPGPIPTPNSNTASISVGSSASTPSIPAVGGISGNVSLPAPSSGSGATITATSSLVAPSGIPALLSSARSVQDTTTVYLYESFTPSITITFPSAPSISVALPAGTNMSQSFYLAFYSSGWDKVHALAGTVSGNSVTFPSQPGPVTLTAGQPLYFAVYGVLVTAPVSPVLSPSSLSFTATGSAANQTFTVSEAGYSGSFAAGTCASSGTTIANIASGPSANQFTVTPVAAGTCSASISDSNGNHATLSVTVTTTTVGGS